MNTTRKNTHIPMIAILLLMITACGGGPTDISGSYDVAGTNPDGSAYNGTAEITGAGENTYNVTWFIGGNASQVIDGTGTLDGDIFITDDGANTATYTLQPDGTLDGTWVSQGGGLGTEVLTPQ